MATCDVFLVLIPISLPPLLRCWLMPHCHPLFFSQTDTAVTIAAAAGRIPHLSSFLSPPLSFGRRDNGHCLCDCHAMPPPPPGRENAGEKRRRKTEKEKFPCRLKGINSWIRLPAGQIETRRRQSALPVPPPFYPRKNRHLVSLSRLLIVWIDSKEKILLPLPSSSLSTMRPSSPPCRPIPLRRRRRLLQLINLAEGDLDQEKAPLSLFAKRLHMPPPHVVFFVPFLHPILGCAFGEGAEKPDGSGDFDAQCTDITKRPSICSLHPCCGQRIPFSIPPALLLLPQKERKRSDCSNLSLFFVPPNFDLSHTAPFFASSSPSFSPLCTALSPPRPSQAGAIKMPLFLSCSFLSPPPF